MSDHNSTIIGQLVIFEIYVATRASLLVLWRAGADWETRIRTRPPAQFSKSRNEANWAEPYTVAETCLGTLVAIHAMVGTARSGSPEEKGEEAKIIHHQTHGHKEQASRCSAAGQLWWCLGGGGDTQCWQWMRGRDGSVLRHTFFLTPGWLRWQNCDKLNAPLFLCFAIRLRNYFIAQWQQLLDTNKTVCISPISWRDSLLDHIDVNQRCVHWVCVLCRTVRRDSGKTLCVNHGYDTFERVDDISLWFWCQLISRKWHTLVQQSGSSFIVHVLP